MAQTKERKKQNRSARSNRSTRTNRSRGKTSAKRQSASQSRTKRVPSKTVLRQLAKDWDHVT
jgi:hypothetical protein